MKSTKILNLASAVLIMATASSCRPDEGTDNGLSAANLNADFAVSQTSANHYSLSASATNYMLSRWDLGDGAGSYNGKMVENVFLPDEGTYTVTHYAVGAGGSAATATKTIVVPTSDPNSGNLVSGGKFANSSDWSKWTVNNTGAGAQWTFSSGKATLTAKGNAGQGIYQPINVIAGKKYNIDMVASSTSGCVDTWFEVYVGYNMPVQGSDYNGDGTVYRSINTWDGSGKSAFGPAKISVIGAVNDKKNIGTFTASKTGTVYLGIRGGGGDMKDGIAITNVEFRGIN